MQIYYHNSVHLCLNIFVWHFSGETLAMKGLTLNCMDKKKEAVRCSLDLLKCPMRMHIPLSAFHFWRQLWNSTSLCAWVSRSIWRRTCAGTCTVCYIVPIVITKKPSSATSKRWKEIKTTLRSLGTCRCFRYRCESCLDSRKHGGSCSLWTRSTGPVKACVWRQPVPCIDNVSRMSFLRELFLCRSFASTKMMNASCAKWCYLYELPPCSACWRKIVRVMPCFLCVSANA